MSLELMNQRKQKSKLYTLVYLTSIFESQ